MSNVYRQHCIACTLHKERRYWYQIGEQSRYLLIWRQINKKFFQSFSLYKVDDYLTTQYLNFTNENINLDSKLSNLVCPKTLENNIISENYLNKIK